MDDYYFPFIYEKNNKESEPLPLYIEVIAPPLKQQEKEEEKESKIIIIDLF